MEEILYIAWAGYSFLDNTSSVSSATRGPDMSISSQGDKKIVIRDIRPSMTGRSYPDQED